MQICYIFALEIKTQSRFPQGYLKLKDERGHGARAVPTICLNAATHVHIV